MGRSGEEWVWGGDWGEELVIAAESKTNLAPAGTRSADSDFRAYFEVTMAANSAGSASQQTVSSLLNQAMRLLSDESMTEVQSNQESVRSERVAANFR